MKTPPLEQLEFDGDEFNQIFDLTTKINELVVAVNEINERLDKIKK